MKISVTQKHIDAGELRQCQKCPVALAIIEALDGIQMPGAIVRAELYHIKIVWCDRWTALETPTSVSHFMKWFDYGLKVIPFEFELPLRPFQAWSKKW